MKELDNDEEGEIMKKKFVAPRSFQISKKDADKHGYTRGCAGCTSWFRGLARHEHNPDCRRRFEEAMESEAKVQRSADGAVRKEGG